MCSQLFTAVRRLNDKSKFLRNVFKFCHSLLAPFVRRHLVPLSADHWIASILGTFSDKNTNIVYSKMCEINHFITRILVEMDREYSIREVYDFGSIHRWK